MCFAALTENILGRSKEEGCNGERGQKWMEAMEKGDKGRMEKIHIYMKYELEAFVILVHFHLSV